MITTSSTKHRQSLVVVGNGMASYAFLRRLVELNVADAFHVTVIGEEPRPAYDRVNLTDYLFDRSADELELAPREWYAEHDFTLRTGQLVTALDRVNCCVELAGGDSIDYGHCVLATGARPHVPDLEGTDLPGVLVYRTIEDLDRIRDYAAGRESVSVVGGGLLGLEAAKALLDLKLEPHVFHIAPTLMSRQLDARAGDMLRQKIEQLGVRIHLPRLATRISAVGDRLCLHFGEELQHQADLVIICAGIRPRDELPRAAGLACGEHGGVQVDAQLRSTDPRVYAIGECAAVGNVCYGLVSPCYTMAQTLAGNFAQMVHGEVITGRFENASEPARLKRMGVDVTTLGQRIGEMTDVEMYHFVDEDSCRALMVRHGLVQGAFGVGPWADQGRVADVIQTATRVSHRQLARFTAKGTLFRNRSPASVASWPATATVCSCLSINRGQLSLAVREGAEHVDDLVEMTGASTVCGSCRGLLADLCGCPGETLQVSGWRALLVASLLAALLVSGYALVGPLPFAASVQSQWYVIDALWRDSFLKQVTGYSLVGVSTLGILFSLRKRWTRFSLGDYGWWRAFHGAVGLATIIGFLVHTGLHMGDNFTFVLASVFLGLNLIGAFTGAAASLESSNRSQVVMFARWCRPWLVRFHLWAFWPLPVLIVFHIFSVYYY